jgi:hypothetical protein
MNPKRLDSIDSKCMELARHFLADEPNITEEDLIDLAGDIQMGVENWFDARDHEYVVDAEGDESSASGDVK